MADLPKLLFLVYAHVPMCSENAKNENDFRTSGIKIVISPDGSNFIWKTKVA